MCIDHPVQAKKVEMSAMPAGRVKGSLGRGAARGRDPRQCGEHAASGGRAASAAELERSSSPAGQPNHATEFGIASPLRPPDAATSSIVAVKRVPAHAER